MFLHSPRPIVPARFPGSQDSQRSELRLVSLVDVTFKAITETVILLEPVGRTEKLDDT